MAALDEARAALERGDDAGALEALLTAWRATRNQRIADAIDGCSARLIGKSKGVEAKTVKARTAAWLELAAKATARDVGTLLATPWPGKWQDAHLVVSALIALPHDPRTAMALARLLEETPWDSWHSRAFWIPLVRHLGALGDLRVSPILVADLTRVKSSYWQEYTRPIVQNALGDLGVASLEKTELSASDEAAVALFIGNVAQANAEATSEEELLAAIYAAPDDDTPRAVFADWLLERNDPRGEFISLQLARSGTPAAVKREAALLAKHGAMWAGRLHSLVAAEGRVFERGFLARGTFVTEQRARTLPSRVEEPAWATVHTLTLDSSAIGVAAELLSLPELQHLRTLRSCFETVVSRLAPHHGLEELELVLIEPASMTEEWREKQRLFAEGETFPNLRRLVLAGSFERVQPFLEGALGQRLEEVTVANHSLNVGAVVHLLEKLALPALREIRVVDYLYATNDMWRLAMRRDASGRLTILHGVAHRAGRGIAEARDLVRALRTIEASELTAFSIDRSEPAYYDVETIQFLEAELARFTALTSIEVPWQRVAPPPRMEPGVMPVTLELRAPAPFVGASFDVLWRLSREPPVSLLVDGYAVNRGAHAALPADALALALAQKALAKKRTHSLDLYRSSARDHCRLEVHNAYAMITSVLRDEPDAVTDYLGWLTRICDELVLDTVTIRFVEGRDQAWSRRLELFNVDMTWIWLVDPALDARIPFAELEQLPTRAGLEWIRTFRTARTLAIALGPSPAVIPTEAQCHAFEIAVLDVMWRASARMRGFIPHERVAAVLGPILERHGFTRVKTVPIAGARGKLLYVWTRADETRVVSFESIDPHHETMELQFLLTHTPGTGIHDPIEPRRRRFGPPAPRVATAAEMEAVLAAAAIDLEAALPWFETATRP